MGTNAQQNHHFAKLHNKTRNSVSVFAQEKFNVMKVVSHYMRTHNLECSQGTDTLKIRSYAMKCTRTLPSSNHISPALISIYAQFNSSSS
jgi:hypothetical protein